MLGFALTILGQWCHAADRAKRCVSGNEHVAATQGVRCRKDADVIDEAPVTYTVTDDVMKALREQLDVVHTLHQVVCVKG